MRISSSIGPLIEKFGYAGAVRSFADAGFNAVDLSLYDMALLPERDSIPALAMELNDLACEKGIVFNQAHAPYNRYVEGYLKEVVPTLPGIFKLCSAVGVPAIVIHPLKDSARMYTDNIREMFEVNLSFYNSLAPLAEEYGVRIAIENMFHRNPETYAITPGICSDPAEHIALYENLDKKELYTLCLDIGHSVLTGQDPAGVIRALGADRLTCLHIQDLDGVGDLHTLPGISTIPFDPILRALGEINYLGDITLECHNFLNGFEEEFLPTAIRFMAQRADYLADKVEEYRVR